MINFQNVFVSYTKEFDALHDLSLKIEKGEKVAIVGDSDSGKTTLLRTIANLQPITKGELTIKDTVISKVNFKQDVSLGYIPKVPVFKNKKTVGDNLMYVLKIRGYEQASMTFKVLSALKNFGIESLKNVPVESLTFTQKMLVQLARVSMRNVEIILIDNITKGLVKDDQNTLIKAIKLLMELNPDATMVFATDSEKIAKELNLKVIKLKRGEIEVEKKSKPAQQIVKNEAQADKQ